MADGLEPHDNSASTEDYKEAVWADLFTWADDAGTYVFKPHDRPAPIVEGPAISWGVTLRPHADEDPLLTNDLKEETRRKRQWINSINDVVRLFLHHSIIAPTPDKLPWFELWDGTDSAPEDGKDDGLQIKLESRHFPFIWRGVFGVLSVETHTEFVKFLFVLSAAPSLRPDNPFHVAGALGNDYENLIDASHIRDSPEQTMLADALDKIGASDGAFEEREVEVATDVVFEKLWFDFASDLRRIANDATFERGEDSRTRIKQPGETLFPGEMLNSLRTVIASADPEWRTWDPTSPVSFGWSDGQEYQTAADGSIDRSRRIRPDVEAYHTLHERRGMIDMVFPPSVDREFVANRVLSGRHIFMSPLGSTIRTEMLRAQSDLKQGEEKSYLRHGNFGVPPSRALILLRSRPQPHQLGRLVERLHALQTLRIMALTDYNKLIKVGGVLRRLGLEFDQEISATPEDGLDERQTKKLISILSELQELGKGIRGGLNYRVSRSNLYVETFERRMDEMQCSDKEFGEIAGWQPYDEFIRRRLAHSFNYLSNLSGRRDRLFRRVGLLIERLQWKELNEVQKDAHNTLRSTDEIAYVAITVSAAAVGLEIGEAIARLLPDYYANVAPVIGAPANILQATAGDKALFGAIVGFGIGLYASFWLYVLRFGRSWVQSHRPTNWWRKIVPMAFLGGLFGAFLGDDLMDIAESRAPETTTQLRAILSNILEVSQNQDILVGATLGVSIGAIGWVVYSLSRVTFRGSRKRN